MGHQRRMIRCPTRRHAKPDDLTNWQVELRTVWSVYAACDDRSASSGSRRSLLSPNMHAGIRRLTTSLNNAGRYKFKVRRRRTSSYKVLSSFFTKSHPRPQWITLSSVEVWLQTCCLVLISPTVAEIYYFTRYTRCYWACGGARAFTTLSGEVDNTHRAAYTPRGRDEVSLPKPLLVNAEYSWLDEVANHLSISSRNSQVIHAGEEIPSPSPPLLRPSFSILKQVSTIPPIRSKPVSVCAVAR